MPATDRVAGLPAAVGRTIPFGPLRRILAAADHCRANIEAANQDRSEAAAGSVVRRTRHDGSPVAA